MHTPAAFEPFFVEVAAALGPDAVNQSAETLNRYAENTMPGGDRMPAGVAYPASTADVQTIVRAANRHAIPLYPISTGNNIGLGSRSASRAGQVVVDLGYRMNRILDVDERLGFAVVEPGVSYQVMYDELVRRGDKLMLDVTSGPPQGGMIGNALDKGAGYTPYFDHFGFACGMEVVLGNGDVLRTGDGALDASELVNWHTSKYSFGPILDGLFTQSNYGIVTRMGLWLLPSVAMVRSSTIPMLTNPQSAIRILAAGRMDFWAARRSPTDQLKETARPICSASSSCRIFFRVPRWAGRRSKHGKNSFTNHQCRTLRM